VCVCVCRAAVSVALCVSAALRKSFVNCVFVSLFFSKGPTHQLTSQVFGGIQYILETHVPSILS
jgi:hypothetical protein